MNLRAYLLEFVVAVTAGALMVACDPGDAPAAPSVDALDELTNENPLTVTGSAEAGALVEIRGGAGGVAEGTAGDDGDFSIDVMLNADADNTLLVSQTVDGLESDAVMVMVTHDGTAPNAPEVDAVITPTRRSSQTIRGMAEPDTTVRISGGLEEVEGTADAMGRFELRVMLNEDAAMAVDNELSVVATDLAGNESAATEVTITFDPTLPIEAPVLDDFPAFTNTDTVTLTGEAEAGAEISAAGGATDGTTTVADDGSFSVEVGLRPNQRNEIRVFAQLTGELSPPATAVIVHDDVAPAAPNVDPEASPTGAEIVRITGLSEPGVTIEVTGGAADASGMADMDGTFSVDVMLTLDSVNSLSVTAVDAAGNVSDPVVLDIEQDSSLEAPIQVDPVTSPTSDATVTLSGTAPMNANVEISGGASTVTTMADGSGSWSTPVDLNLNARNELHVYNADTPEDMRVETIVVIVHDDTPPDAPTLNTIPSPTGNTMIAVSGTSEPLAQISVSGATSPASARAETDGRFSVDIVIAEDTETTLSVIATDRAGNTSSPSMATVTHSSDTLPAPNVDVENPPDTSSTMYTINGDVPTPAADIMVRVRRGGTEIATAPTDPSTGDFSVDVTLDPNAVNELHVTAFTGSIESGAVIVTITHDDVAPAAPDASAITTSSSCTDVLGVRTRNGGTVTGGSGAVEPNGIVHVENLETGATRSTAPDTAAPSGSFSVGLPMCPGDRVEVSVEDEAGNISPAIEVVAS